MSRRSPFEVCLSNEERAILKQRASSGTPSHREVVRARIVLLAADGLENVGIARQVGVCVDVASKWRKRFCQEGVEGLADRHRSGRPRFDAKVVAGVKAMACEPPEQRDGMTAAERLELGLLVGGDHVVGGAERDAVEHPGVEVEHPGGLSGEVGIAGEDPRPEAPRLDRRGVKPPAHRRRGDGLNGSSHNGQRSIDRMTAAWPNAHLAHLPVHASWLNQIEIVFSIIQRKVGKPADFADLDELANRLRRFEERYNLTARPFDWRFTGEDLAAMLERLDVGPSHIAAPLAA